MDEPEQMWRCIWCQAEYPFVLVTAYFQHIHTHDDLWKLQNELDDLYPAPNLGD